MTTVLYSNGMFYRRKLLDRIERELTTREATVITGPRQVGKTTILKYLFDLTKSPNKAFFDFENPFDRLFLKKTILTTSGLISPKRVLIKTTALISLSMKFKICLQLANRLNI